MIILTTNAGTIQLPSANFGDGERIHLGLTVKRAMDGTLWANHQTPPRKVYFFSVSGLNIPKRRQLEGFLKDSRGQRFEILFDYPEPDLKENNTPENAKRVIAILLSTPFEAVHQGIRNTTAALEFEELPNEG